MSKHTSSFMKRYFTYRAIRGTEKAAKGAVRGAWSVFKLILTLAALLVVITCAVIALPYILIVIALIAVIVLIVYLVRRKNGKAGNPPLGTDLRRDAEIVRDCQELINNSENLETVAQRYQTLVSLLSEMQNRPQADFDYYGVSLGAPISTTLSVLDSNRTTIFCQAIDRAFAKCKKHIDGLKTKKGKQNALYKFRCDTRSIVLQYNLPDACIAHLDAIVSSCR